MVNQIMIKRICKLIAITYALSEYEVWQMYEKTNSIDIIIKKLSK
ncbi:MAG: hypothetical protein ACTSWG_10345 [Candidatus Helarchaeota archaeon]